MPLNRIARSALVALFAAVCCVGAPLALAQPLPDSLVGSDTPDTTAIQNYVKPHLDTLGSAETTAKARKSLTEPLQRSQRPTSAVRIAYSRAVMARVGPLTKDPSDDVAVNALRICGLLGTQEGLEVACVALGDKREAVRVAAAHAIDVALASAHRGTPAIGPRQATDALDSLNAAIGKEQSPRVLDAISLALDSAIRIPEANLIGVWSRAFDIILNQTTLLAKRASGPEFDGLFGHFAKTLSDALSTAGKFTAQQKNDAAIVAGDIIARAVRRLGDLSDQQRIELAIAVEQAELVIKYSNPPQNFRLGASLRAGKDAEFKDDANKLFQILHGPPYNATPADRYNTK